LAFSRRIEKSKFEELANCGTLASPCEGEGDRLRWRGRKNCRNVKKSTSQSSARSLRLTAYGPRRNHRLLRSLATNMPPACLLNASSPLSKGSHRGASLHFKFRLICHSLSSFAHAAGQIRHGLHDFLAAVTAGGQIPQRHDAAQTAVFRYGNPPNLRLAHGLRRGIYRVCGR